MIVLVITIIVIIILSVAVILSISNNNPIENARKARFQNDLKTIQEEITLHIANEYANRYETYNLGADPDIPKIVNNYKNYKDKIKVIDGEILLLTEEINEQECKWGEEININTYPVIPVGFKHIEGTVETGYVIQNETDENEFVWVPVEDFSEFKRESFTSIELNETEYTEPYTEEGADSSEKVEYEAMMKSVKNNHGFYIARYEASDNGSGVAQSKKNEQPWFNIKWGNSSTDLSGGAVEKARAVYSNSNKAEGSKYAVSTLSYGVQWDATVRWLKKNYPSITEDSSQYGNYGNTTSTSPKETGSEETYKTNNIYDMCGNLMEWTMEANSNDKRIYRGGNFLVSGEEFSISNRIPYNTATAVVLIGYRLALYIK